MKRAATLSWLAILGLALCLTVPFERARPTLDAQARSDQFAPGFDRDGDGLVDVIELYIGTDPEIVDSDGDGYSDSEEFARKASPTRTRAMPNQRDLSMRMTVFSKDDRLHVVTAMYVDRFADLAFEMGTMVEGRLVPFPREYLASIARVRVVQALDSRDQIMIVDLPISPARVHLAGSMSIWATAGTASACVVETADAVNLFSAGDPGERIITMRVPVGDDTATTYAMQTGGGGGPTSSASQQANQQGASVYRPVPTQAENPGSSIPSTWTPGQVCVQQSTVVGSGGGVVTNEVVDSECVEEWDAYCDPGCQASIGHLYRTVDAVSLIGG